VEASKSEGWPPVRYRLASNGDVIKYADDFGELRYPAANPFYAVLNDVLLEDDARKFLMAFSFTLERILLNGGSVSAYSIDKFMELFEGIDPVV
jgi:hypothetical protein